MLKLIEYVMTELKTAQHTESREVAIRAKFAAYGAVNYHSYAHPEQSGATYELWNIWAKAFDEYTDALPR